MIKNTIEDILSKYVGGKIDIANEQKSISMQRRKVFSSIITDSFYVLDIVQKQFIYIKPDDLFLCGHSVHQTSTTRPFPSVHTYILHISVSHCSSRYKSTRCFPSPDKRHSLQIRFSSFSYCQKLKD